MSDLDLCYGYLTSSCDLAILASDISTIGLSDHNYIPLRSKREVIVSPPCDESLGASRGWIERHSDTCITSLGGLLRTDSDTLLCLFVDAYVCPFSFSIIVNYNKIVAESHHTLDVMRWIANRNSQRGPNGSVAFYDSRPSGIPLYEDPCFILNSRWASTNYYHWIHECIPRLIYACNVLPMLSFNVNFVWYGKKNTLKPFHLETLERLGISLYQVDFLSSPHVFRRLVHLTFIDPGLVSSFQANLIRSMYFLPDPLKFHLQSRSRLLVLRNKNGARYLDITRDFRLLIEKYSLSPVVLENCSFIQQLELFAGAEVVIAPHGAGLTNIIFCNDAHIIEIMPSDSVHPMFMQIASSVSLRYAMYVARTQAGNFQRMCVDSEMLESFIEIALKS